MRYGSIEDRARHSVRNAVRDGKITKPEACEQCGKKVSLQAHHTDYEQPLAVKWLCAPCHGIEHRKHQGPSELQSLREENARLRAALKEIAEDPGGYPAEDAFDDLQKIAKAALSNEQ